MEGTVMIPLEEYKRLKGLDEQFDDQVKAARANAETTAKIDILRDRDEYIRRNELLLKEKAEAQEAARRVSESNVKLRAELDKTKAELAKVEKFHALARMELDSAEYEVKKRIGNEATLNEAVTRLREERRELLIERDALLGRGIFSRIFNRRP